MFGFMKPDSSEAYNKAIKLYNENHKKGMDKMKKLCDKRNPKAALFIRNCMLKEIENIVDEREKEKYSLAANNMLRMAADYGDIDSQFEMGTRFETGDGFEKNKELSFRYYLMAAKNGNLKSQTNVGRCYSLGLGVEQNAKEAKYWQLKAANQGETISMISVALGYANGKGLPKDNDKAIEWYEKALARAKYLLDTRGEGGEEFCVENEQKAIHLATEGLKSMEVQVLCEEYRETENEYLKSVKREKIERLANEGKGRAQFEMGLICEDEEDYYMAKEWYFKAGEQGSSGAMTRLGLIMYEGKGISKHYDVAFKWFSFAVEHAANTYAMFMLGQMYEKGQYVDKDMDIAIDWYKKADIQGCEEAHQRLKELGI